jgi:hypothetical protein
MTIARELKELLSHDAGLEVSQLAEEIGVSQEDVAHVLDTYAPTEDGVEQVGVGRGGGWVNIDAARKAGALVGLIPLAPEDIGYRWPDGELREEPYQGA